MPRSSPRHAQLPELVAFGEAIRQKRLALGLTQEALAHDAGIDRSYLSSVERGSQNIGLVSAIHVARVLSLKLADLLRTAGL